MLKNYIKIAYRTILRKRVFSLVNILGLSVGIASCIVISTYLLSETSFDKFHTDHERIYRVLETISPADQQERIVSNVGGGVGFLGSTQIAGIEDYTRIFELGVLNMYRGDQEFGEPFFSFDLNFFQFFDFPLLSGDPASVFKDPMSVVISESIALKYFGNEDPIGKVIGANANDQNFGFTVTGVMAEMPANSHLNFQMIFPHTAPDKMFPGLLDYQNKQWNVNIFTTYFRLGPNVDRLEVEGLLASTAHSYTDENKNVDHEYSLQALSDVHFNGELIENELNYREGNRNYMYIFLFVGLIILAIAFANYINLSTIKATDRIKEIGLRKVVGATKKQLTAQFISESILLSYVALTLAFTLLQFLGPLITSIFGSNLLSYANNTQYILILMLVVLVLGIISGAYPAIIVSRAKPINALKNTPFRGSKQTVFRGVVLFQFVIALGMIVATIIVNNQLKFINNKDLGYDQEAVAIIEINSDKARESRQTIMTEFERQPSVLSVSAMSRVPAEWKSYVEVFMTDVKGQEYVDIPFIGASESFTETLGMEVLAGRNFRPDGSDSLSILINETLARQLGIDTPGGQLLRLTGAKRGAQVFGLQENPTFKVVGIINDFHFQSLRDEIPPMVFGYQFNPIQNIDYFVVKLNTQQLVQAMEGLKTIMKKFDPSPFDYSFMDDKLERYYVEDKLRSKLFFVASFIAVFISFIGLFALVHFSLQKRLKEMSIRRVLGASINSLMALLSSQYLKLLLVAVFIALPLAYFGMENWLEDFAYRTGVQWWVFGLAFLVCLGITVLTTLTQVNKVARKKPSDILRHN